jgi:hypothetical protein
MDAEDRAPDSPADSRADDRAGGRWMSLKELAASRRISVASAARLMRRRHWRRQPGNDGHIRVWVPAGEQEPKAETRPDDRADVSADVRSDSTSDIRADALADIRSGVMEVVRPLQDAIAVLEAQLTEANARATRSEQAVADERVRADILRDRLEALQAELRRTQHAAEVRAGDAEQAARIALGTVETLRRAEEARRGRGRWARLRAAWRGE